MLQEIARQLINCRKLCKISSMSPRGAKDEPYLLSDTKMNRACLVECFDGILGGATYVPERNKKIMLFPQQTFHVSNLSSCTDSEQSWQLGCVHKCMWKADFGAVDSAIACRLEHCEDVMVTRIEDNSFGGSLCREAFQISYRITRGGSRFVVP